MCNNTPFKSLALSAMLLISGASFGQASFIPPKASNIRFDAQNTAVNLTKLQPSDEPQQAAQPKDGKTDKTDSAPQTAVDTKGPALEYLATLQRLFSAKPALNTPAERDQFCKVWRWLMASMKVESLPNLKKEDLKQLVTCEGILGYLDSIRQTPYSNPTYDVMRVIVEERVRAGAGKVGLKLAYQPVIGAIPASILNAKVISVPKSKEPLIVINSEVFRLPYETSKAVVQAIDFKTHANGYASANTDGNQINKYLDAHPEVVKNYEYAVLRYLHRVSEAPPDSPIALDTSLGFVSSQLYYGLADAVEVFIFSHEFAHVLLGHKPYRNSPLTLDGKTVSPVTTAEIIYSWKQELEADAYGFLILDAVLEQDAVKRSGDLKSDPYYPFFISAPRFFFLNMDLVERSKSILESGKAKPPLSEKDIELAQKALSQISEPDVRHDDPPAGGLPSEQSNTHPPFLIRYIQAQLIEEKARELFLKNHKMPRGTEQVYRFAPLFQDTLRLLSERTEPMLLELYKNTGAQDDGAREKQGGSSVKEVKVLPNDLSSSLVYEELKERGLDVFDRNKAGTLTDDFIRYDFLSRGDAPKLLSDSPNVEKAAEKLAGGLEKVGLRSKVLVKTREPGARIHFRLIGRDAATASTRLTNDTEEEIPIGLYYVWAERQGVVTSLKKDVFRIVKPKVIVEIEENRNGRQ